MKKRTVSIIVVFVVLHSACFLAETPEQTLEKYYKYHAPDLEGIDPLILAGDRVVPLVIEKITAKDMPKRQGAIGFLGNGSYRQAIPVLERILADESEHEYIRADSLHAIFQIDGSLGSRYSVMYRERSDALGERANDILQSKEYLNNRRTYWDALLGRHD